MNDMCSRSVGVVTLVAWGAWLLGVLLIVACCFGLVAEPIALLGVASVALGCIASVRLMIDGVLRRERNAYELGRDSVRSIR